MKPNLTDRIFGTIYIVAIAVALYIVLKILGGIG